MTGRRLRASELGQFEFCQRAWWYARQGHPTTREAEVLEGIRWHHRHGRQVLAAGCLRIMGYVFLLAAVVTTVAYLTTFTLR